MGRGGTLWGSMVLSRALGGSMGLGSSFCVCQAADRHIAGTWFTHKLNNSNTKSTH